MTPDRRSGLIRARKAAGLSQKQLAERLGVTRVSVARWEVGMADPSLATALEVAQILGKRVEQLFGDEPLYAAEEVAEARRLHANIGSKGRASR